MGCIKKIESLCSRFLWAGNIETRSKAKVAWSTVCLPKNEGGLGLRRISDWNTTLCLRLIWLLFSNSGSLWVAWQIHHHGLDAISFWDVQLKNGDSWLWKCLLKIRHLAKKFIRCSVGNGNKGWFWHDNWSPLGPLLDLLGENGPRELRIPRNARVSDACTSHGWKMAPPRSDHAVSLQIFLSSISLPSASHEVNSFDWYIDDKSCSGFSSSRTWEVLRHKVPEKDWAKLIWFKGSTPKHAFHMWLTNLDRLPTRSRLASWGLPVPIDCCLCAGSEETRDHLFLHCPFTQIIWNCSLLRLKLPLIMFGRWSSLMEWAKVRSISSPPILRLLLIHALIYSVWRQRNNLLHNQIAIPPLTVFKEIDRLIINSISARKKLKKFKNLMGLWFY